MQIVFKSKTILGNSFHFKDRIPKDLTSGVFYKFQFGICDEPYCDEWVRRLNGRVSGRKNSSVADHEPSCNQSASYDNFSILTCENKKLLLQLKEPVNNER